MPKVSKITKHVLGELVTWDVYYNMTKKFHLKDFPQEIRMVSSFDMTHHDTELSLDKVITEALSVYHGAQRSKKKVITYKIGLTNSMYMKRRKDYFDGDLPWVEALKIDSSKICNIHFGDSDGDAIGLQWDVLWCVQGERTEYYGLREKANIPDDLRDDGELGYKTSPDRDDYIIDWTPEREEALKEISKALRKLGRRIAEVVLVHDKMITLLDSGTKLLT